MPYISLYLPMSPCTSLHLLASQAAQEELKALRAERRESITAYSAATEAQVGRYGEI